MLNDMRDDTCDEMRDGAFDAALGALEAVLFVSSEPLSEKQLAAALEKGPDEVRGLLVSLQSALEEGRCGVQLHEIAGGWRLYTNPAYHSVLERFVLSGDSRKLSRAALETLAVVAYLQPATRNDVASVRGVNSDSTLSTLLEKGLIREAGRADAPGSPVLYETTRIFLEHFGLRSAEELPPLEDFAPDEASRDFIRQRLSGKRDYALAEEAEFEALAASYGDAPAASAGEAAAATDGLDPFDGVILVDENESFAQDALAVPAGTPDAFSDTDGVFDAGRSPFEDADESGRVLYDALARSAGIVEKIDFESLR